MRYAAYISICLAFFTLIVCWVILWRARVYADIPAKTKIFSAIGTSILIIDAAIAVHGIPVAQYLSCLLIAATTAASTLGVVELGVYEGKCKNGNRTTR